MANRVTAQQWNQTKKRTANAMANQFFADVNMGTQGISDLLNQQNSADKLKNLTMKKNEVNSLLRRAEDMRQQYAGNKSMLSSVDSATTLLKNISTSIDNVMPQTHKLGFGNSGSDDVSKVLNSENVGRIVAENEQNFNLDMYKRNKGLSFDEISQKQHENTINMNDENRARLNKENRWLDMYKENMATDDDYKKLVNNASKRIAELKKEDKDDIYMPTARDSEALKNAHDTRRKNRENEMEYYQGIIDRYSDDAKYGRSNIEKWKNDVKDLSYSDKKKYIEQLGTNTYQKDLEKELNSYESGKEYINNLADGEKPSAQGFFAYLDDNNKNLYHEMKKSGVENPTEAKKHLVELEKKASEWKSNDDEIDYLENYAKSTVSSYEDYQTLNDEYQKKIDNSKTAAEADKWKYEFSSKYGDNYLRTKQEHNFKSLPENEQQEMIDTIRKQYNTDSRSGNFNPYDSQSVEDMKQYGRNIDVGFEDRKLKELKEKYNFTDSEAQSIIAYAKATVNEELQQKEYEEYYAKGEQSGKIGPGILGKVTGAVASTLQSVPYSLASGIGAAETIWTKLKQGFGGETPVDYNSEGMRIGQRGSAIREGAKSNYDEMGQFIYDAFASTVDSAATLPIDAVVPGATAIILGSSAATQSMLDGHEKGLSDAQAIGQGVAAGIFEGLFEKVSLDKIIEMGDGVSSVKGMLSNIAKSVGIEGSEEGFTEIANILYDDLANGELSDYKISVSDYKKQGYSQSESEKLAKKDLAVRIAQSVGGGALGGAFMGIPVSGYNYAKNKEHRTMAKTGDAILRNNGFEELQEHIAQNYDEESNLYKQMANTDINDSAQVGFLASLAAENEYNQAMESYSNTVNEAVSNRLQELNVPKQIADNMAPTVLGNKNVNAGQYQETYNQVKQELVNGITGREDNWVSDIDLTDRDNHLENARTIEKLAVGESLRKGLSKSVANDVKSKIDEKRESGELSANGTAHLIDNPDVEFTPVELIVGTDGETQVIANNGSNYKMSDVAADANTVAIAELGEQYEPEQRKKFFKAYEQTGDVLSPLSFASYFNMAYDYGKNNLGQASVFNNSRLRNNLTLDQIGMAYDAGKLEYNKNLQKNKADTKTNIKGTVSFDGVDESRLNETQKSAVKVAKVISKAVGCKITFFESGKNQEGKYVGANGSYNSKTNELRIDINAGKVSETEGHNIMILTLSHELTHYAENFAHKEYADLQEFVFDVLSKNTGKDIKELIAEEMEHQRRQNREHGTNIEVTESRAKSELVARGCELVLTDAETIRELAERNRGLFGKIKAKIIEFTDSIINACKEILGKDGNIKNDVISKEAMQMKEYAEKLRTLWNEAVGAAGESNAVKSEKNSVSGGVREMIRYDSDNTPFVEIDSNILDGISEEQWNKKVKEVLKKKFSNGIKVGNNTIWQNAAGRREFIYSGYARKIYSSDKTLYMDKLKISNNIDEVVMASRNYINYDLKHARKDGLKDFAWGTVNIRIGKTDYSADVIVGNNGTRLYLYDVINLKKIKIKERRSNHQRYSQNGKMLNIVASSKSSISQNNKNDNDILKQDSSILYSYGGRNSNNVDLRELQRANEMEKEGKSFEEIFKKTGWFRGIDNIWKYEIDDSKMTFNRRGHLSLKDNQDYRRYEKLSEKVFGSGNISKEEWEEFGQLEKILSVISKFKNGGNTVGDYVQHDELFKQYPFLKDVKLEFVTMDNNMGGWYDGLKNTIYINKKSKSDVEKVKRTMLHELQHVIQKYEGFARGANVEYWKGEKEGGDVNVYEKNVSYIKAQKKIKYITQNSSQEFMEKYREINRSRLKAQESNKESDWDVCMNLERHMYENPTYSQLYQDLEDARWDMASAIEDVKKMTPEDMYNNTAGEIEAWDVSGRMNYSEGQRRSKLPNLGDNNTVFTNNKVYSFSMRESFSEQVDKVLNKQWEGLNALYVTETPEILQQIGLKQLPMLYTKKHLEDALKPKNEKKHYHGLTEAQIKKMPEIIEHPAIVIDSLSRNDSIVVISDICDNDNLPIIVSVRIDGNGVYELKQVASNFITGMYGRKGISALIDRAAKDNKILYINNKKSHNIFSLARVQFPYSLNNYDFDTIIHKSSYVVNNKSAEGKDIRHQDRETSFSVREPVEETRDLIAVHNLSEKNLLENLKLGGFPMPSIAITKASHGFDRFGDISVVFNKDTIDPRNSDNKVYSGDAWTPVFPDTEWKINDKGLKKLANTFHTSANYIEQFVTKPEDAVDKLKEQKEVKRAFLEDKGVTIERKTKMPDYRMPFMNNENVRRFITDRNIGVDDILKNKELQKEISEVHIPVKDNEPRFKQLKRNMLISLLKDGNARVKLEDDFDILKGRAEQIFDNEAFENDTKKYLDSHDEEYTDYVERALDGVYENKYLVKPDVERYNKDGSLKSFRQLHMPYNLENIVRLMKKQDKGKGGGWFGGAKNLKGAAAQKFEKIEQIKENKDKIQNMTDEEWNGFFEGLDNKILEIDNAIINNDGIDMFARMRKNDWINEIMVEAFALNNFNENSVKRLFKKEGIGISDKIYDMMKSLRDELENIPVQYFEAKPERAVGLNEIAYVVIPDSSSEKLKNKLSDKNIQYKEYSLGNENERKNALNSMPEILFSSRENVDPDYSTDNGIASYTEDRLEDLYTDYAAMNEDYSQAYLTRLSPEEFLKLTTEDDDAYNRIISESTNLDKEKLRNNSQPIYLRIYDDGEVRGHEGRHRMAALMNAGITSVPVVLIETSDNYGKEIGDIQRLDSQDFSFGKRDYSVKLGDSIPITRKNDALIREKFLNSGDVLFQDRTISPRTYSLKLKDNVNFKEGQKNADEMYRKTKGVELSDRAIDMLVKKLEKDSGTNVSSDVLHKKLKKTFENARTKDLTGNELVKELRKIAAFAINDKNDKQRRTTYAQNILNEVRKNKVYVTERQRSYLKRETGLKYEEWRRSMFGKVNLTNNVEDGVTLDAMWQEYSRLYPEVFKSDVKVEEQPLELEKITFALSNEYASNYGFNFDDAALYCATELMATYSNLTEVKKDSGITTDIDGIYDKYQKDMGNVRVEYYNLNREYNKRYQGELNRLRKEWREDQKYHEENIRQRYINMIKQREADIRNREDSVWTTREKEKVRNHIIKSVKSISNMVVNPSNQRHAPEGFKSKVAEFCQQFLKDTSVFRYDDLDRLKVAYEALRGDNDSYSLAGSYDSDIDDMLTVLKNTIRNRRLSKLDRVELEQVKDIVDHFRFIIENENKIWSQGKTMNLERTGLSVIDELSAKKDKVLKRTKSEGVNSLLDKVDGFVENNYTPIYFFKKLGPTFEKLYSDVRKGQDDWGKNIAKATRRISDIKEKYNYDKWDRKRTLKLGGGITLNTEQAMYIYATRQREMQNETQEARHLQQGGIIMEDRVTVKDGKVIKKQKVQQQTYKITDSDLVRLGSFLTMEQKAYVNELVNYLSIDMAKLGNETSMKLYGIKKFGESYYFPYKVARSEISTTASGRGKVTPSLKNAGMTKALTKKAGNAVIVDNFTDTAARHISQMCTYNALAVAQDNINRVYNFKDLKWDEEAEAMVGTGMTVKQLLDAKEGEDAGKYLELFLASINNGLTIDPTEGLTNQLISKFKKGAVYASLSVAIQQPSAICRAFALVDPKYFAQTTFKKRDWEECKKYNGVAVIKELGGFDTGTGQGAVDYLTDSRADSIGRTVQKIDKGLGWLPGYMDQITWCHIWNAVKDEIKDKYNFNGNEAEFFKKASERFDEVINLTQVYDSVLAKSVNMNSKSGLMKSATAFMSEPTVTLNMLNDALQNGNRKYICRAVSAIVLQTVVNAALKALVQAARNSSSDDEDKSYVEKYAKAFSGDVVGDINPLTWIPVVKDIVNIFQGYDVERADLSLITDLYNACQTVMKARDGKKSPEEAVQKMSEAIAAFFGVPLTNINRDIRGVRNLFNDVISNNVLSKGHVGRAFLEGLGITTSNADIINDYIDSGDRKEVDELIENKKVEIKEKYPSYSDEKVSREAISGVRSLITKQLKSRYLENPERKSEIVDFMKKTKMYTEVKKKKTVDVSEDTVNGWLITELKKQYINSTDAGDRAEIKRQLWATKHWKRLRELEKQLKEWTE